MDYEFECRHQSFYMWASRRDIKPSPFNHDHINFNFFCELYRFNWVQTRDSKEHISQDNPITTNTSIDVIVRNDEEVEKSVGRAVTHLPLLDRERRQVMERALGEVRHESVRTELPSGHVSIGMDLQLRLAHDHLFDSLDEFNLFRKVDGDKCVDYSEKYEVDSGERCCCICLEDFSSEAKTSLSCSHVFHGGCIHDWLRTANSCPLCRFDLDAH